ncbi:hypothetical protein R3P38DRAFT_3566850 [Favolaschia claudopus]|uniref:MYND-type domain-containing protein n=1 Tax=Favolaschia claudopus TaxID=2862362 RepID=A0AAW0DUW3_9AGAR
MSSIFSFGLQHTIRLAGDASATFSTPFPQGLGNSTYKQSSNIGCMNCLQGERDVGHSLRECSRCKGVRYCSKECQIQDWPSHKPDCGHKVTVPRILIAACSDPRLSLFMQICCILKFKLFDSGDRAEEFISARFAVAIEPVDLVELGRIMTAPKEGRKIDATVADIQGMLQINGFEWEEPDDGLSSISLPDRSASVTLEVWRKERARVVAAGYPRNPLVMLNILYPANGNVISLPLCISSAARDLVQKSMTKGFDMRCEPTKERKRLPFTIETCMEYMNSYIREDNHNRLHLRTKMRPGDVKVITDYKPREKNFLAGHLFVEKFARETIYKSMQLRITQTVGKFFYEAGLRG